MAYNPGVVAQVVRARQELLSVRLEDDGAIVVCDTAFAFDGDAAAPSKGLFDWSNCPGWDTWIAAISTVGHEQSEDLIFPLLLAWIPASLLDLARSAVPAEPWSINWLDDFLDENRYGSRRFIEAYVSGNELGGPLSEQP